MNTIKELVDRLFLLDPNTKVEIWNEDLQQFVPIKNIIGTKKSGYRLIAEDFQNDSTANMEC